MDKIRKFTIIFSIAILSILQITYSYGNSQSLEQLFENAYQAPLEEAISICQKIIKEYPGTKDAARAQHYIGTRYFREKKYEQAIKAYQRYINNYPEEGPERVALTYSTIASCYEEMFNFDMAKKIYKKIIKEYPTTNSAKLAHQILEHLDDPEYIKSFKMAKKFHELDEATRHSENKEYHQAIAKAKELLVVHQRDPVMVLYIHFFIADCYEKLNNRKEAIREYEKIIKLAISPETVKAAQKRIKEIRGRQLPVLITLTLGIFILIIIGVAVFLKRKKKATTT